MNMLGKIQSEGSSIKNHHNKLLSSISDTELQTFSLLKSDEERFSFVYKLPIAHELELTPSNSSKSSKVAMKVKEQGNKAFQSGDYRSALQLYSKSIMKVPWEQESTRDLAILLANRSAVFYHLELYLPCLQDIELSLSLDYPLEIQYKVYDRKARSLLALKQLKDALGSFRSTLTALDSCKLPFEKKQKFQTDVQIMISMLNRNNTLIKGGLINEPLPASDSMLPQKSKNPRYPSASGNVSIRESAEMGRYAVASNDVKVGDVLVVEKAHCAVLLEEHSNTHCFHCFKKLLALVPCPNCSAVSFCCIQCKDEALGSHHKVECSILAALWSSGSSVTCHMALRILSQRDLKYFLDKRQELEASNGSESKKYDGSNYSSVYHLVRHEASRQPEDFLQRADMAVFLFGALKLGGFFGEANTNADPLSLTDDEKYIGGLLLRHLQLLQFNAHEISELVIEKGSKLESAKSVFLGGGLYPTLALFNHSCNPGVTRYFSGSSVVVCAVTNIEQNDMIGENYGPIFTQMPRDQRLANLSSQYWFQCSCTACLEDWPLFQDMDSGVLRFRCDSQGESRCNNVICVPANTEEFMMSCKACKEHTNILKGLKALQDTDALFRLATRHMESNEVQPALGKFIEILTLLSETLAPPFRDYHLCQQGIRRCLLALGNKTQRS